MIDPSFRLKLRRDTPTNWNFTNPVLAEGEIGIQLSSDPATPHTFKIGNGETAWTDLPFIVPVRSPSLKITPNPGDTIDLSGYLHGVTVLITSSVLNANFNVVLPEDVDGTLIRFRLQGSSTQVVLNFVDASVEFPGQLVRNVTQSVENIGYSNWITV